MSVVQICTALFTALLAAGTGFYAVCAAKRKGPILSNTWLWSSRTEREKLDKNKEYRLLARIFGGLSMAFTANTLYILTDARWLLSFFWLILGAVGVYAVYDSIRSAI